MFVFFLLCERRKERKHDPFSNWLTQTLWDKSWTPTPERGLGPAGPELKAPEKNQMLPTQRKLIFLACWPSPSVVPTPSPSPLLSFPKEIHILFHYFLSIEMTLYINFHLSFSIVSSYIAQFRNFSETDFINNLTGKD